MKSMLFFQLRSLLILISLLVSILVSAGELHEVKLGKTQFTQKLSNNLVVEVGLHQMLVNGNCLYKNALLWGGDVDEPPKGVMASLDVKVNAEKIFIPFSAYGDLGEVKAIALEKIAGGFNLIVTVRHILNIQLNSFDKAVFWTPRSSRGVTAFPKASYRPRSLTTGLTAVSRRNNNNLTSLIHNS